MLRHPQLIRRMRDEEYRRRLDRDGPLYLMLPVPLLIFSAFCYRHYGELPPLGTVLACVSLTLIYLYVGFRGKRDALQSMRREGLSGDDYQPPPF